MKRCAGRVAGLFLLCGVSKLWGQVRREIQFPDLPGQRTLKCDFHAHTVFSDGDVWPVVRVQIKLTIPDAATASRPAGN